MAFVLAALAPTPAWAQTSFGVHAGIWGDGSDPLVGVELLTPLAPHWYFNPNLEFVPGDRVDRLILNGDLHYDLDVDRPTFLWVGGGLAILHSELDLPFGRDASETDAGLNLLAGGGWQTPSGMVPYVQGKAVIADDSSAVLVLGLRF